jgi:hypothetical protein
VQQRVATFPLGWAAALFAVAQLADLVTALQVARELNPIAAIVLSHPLLGLVVKLLLIAFVIGVAQLVARQRPALARLLLLFGALAGIAGVISNTQLTPFVGV